MDRGYAFLCFLLVLAASAQSGVGQSIGSIHIYNGAAGTMTRQMSATLTDGSQSSLDPVAVPFPQGTQFIHEVLPTEKYIYSMLHLVVPSGAHEWSNPIMWSASSWSLLNCMPNCYIVIDNRGFWQAASEHSYLDYYWGWSWGQTSSESKMPLGQH